MIGKPVHNVRDITSLKELLEQSSKLFGNKTAFYIQSHSQNNKSISYSEFKDDVDALGTALINLGLQDKYIAIIGENRYEWCLSYLSIVNGVGVAVPLDKELPYHELENLLMRSNAGAVIYSGKHVNEIKKVSENLSNLHFFITMDEKLNDMDLEKDSRFMTLTQLVQAGRQQIKSGDKVYVNSEINPELFKILIFTSGTTDFAKGVMLSHKNICSDIMAVTSSIYIDSNDSVLSVLPLHHTYECTAGFLTMLYSGCTISFCEGIKHIANNLKETSPSILILVPLIIENMYKKIWTQANKKLSTKIKLKTALFLSTLLYNTFKIDIRRKLFKQILNNVGGKIRLIISGAAALDPDVSKGFRAMGIPVIQGYGLTEASPIVTVNQDKAYRHDSIGLPLPGVDVVIDSPDNEGFGEIKIKGPNVMLGYFENQTATNKVLKDNWLYTGDLGKMDKNGFFYITGRKKNVIVTKNGKNIFPEEVEAYLNKSPYIKESLVWGKIEDNTGEMIVYAQIVPDIDAITEKFNQRELSSTEIHKLISEEVKAVNRNMPRYKHIYEFTIRENEFIKTTTKKIKRYAEKL